jgi:hypothetical protein
MIETVAIGIPNPRSVVSMPIPPGLSSEQIARIEAEIDRINAELEVTNEQESHGNSG